MLAGTTLESSRTTYFDSLTGITGKRIGGIFGGPKDRDTA
jgi:hypothetical protein